MIIRTSVAVMVFWLTLAGNVAAQTVVVTPPVNIPVSLIRQDNDEWCWLAVAQMILQYRQGFSAAQCELIERWDMFPSGECCADLSLCRRFGGDLGELAALLRSHGVLTRYGLPILPSALYSLIMSDLPVIARLRTGEITHAVIIRGMRYEGRTAYVIINDPVRRRSYEMAYQDFAAGWLDSLVVLR
ncbi:MAG: papain-like cysteine protease family protein [Patescibacteria group bacterium]